MKFLIDASFNEAMPVQRSNLTELKQGDLFVSCSVLDVNEVMIPMSAICCAVTLIHQGEFFMIQYVRPFIDSKPDLDIDVDRLECIGELDDPEVYILSLDIYTEM